MQELLTSESKRLTAELRSSVDPSSHDLDELFVPRVEEALDPLGPAFVRELRAGRLLENEAAWVIERELPKLRDNDPHDPWFHAAMVVEGLRELLVRARIGEGSLVQRQAAPSITPLSEIVERTSEDIRAVARRLGFDHRNAPLCEQLRAIATLHFDPVRSALLVSSSSEISGRLDRAMTELFSLYLRTCPGAGEARIETFHEAPALPFKSWAHSTAHLGNIIENTGRELRSLGIELPGYIATHIRRYGTPPEEPNGTELLVRLRMELQGWGSIHMEDATQRNLELARAFYKLDFDLQELFGGSLVEIIQDMLEPGRPKEPDTRSAEELTNEFRVAIGRLNDLLDGKYVERLEPLQPTEECRADLVYSLRALRSAGQRAAAGVNFGGWESGE